LLWEKQKKIQQIFIQVCGGPVYFNKKRGKPRLFKRHMPHKITAERREEWLKCYRKVLGKMDVPGEVKQSFWNYIDIFSIWMVNA